MNIISFKIREWLAHHSHGGKNQTIAAQAERIRNLVSENVGLRRQLMRATEIAYGLSDKAYADQTFNADADLTQALAMFGGMKQLGLLR